MINLKRRILILVATAILPMFAFSAYKTWRDAQNDVEVAKANMRFAASLAAAEQSSIADAAKNLLSSIANNRAITRSDNLTCGQILETLSKSYPAYSNIGLANLDGRVRCDAVHSGGNLVVGDRRYFKEAIANNSFAVGEYSIGRASGRPVLVFAHPWHDATGAAAGVVFASITLQELFKAIGNTVLPAAGWLTILDRNGIVLSTNEPMLEAGKPVRNAEISSAMRSGQTISGEMNYGNTDRVFGLAPLPGASQSALFVKSTIDRSSVTSATSDVLFDHVSLLLLVTLVATTAAWTFGGRAIVAPADAESARMLAEIRQLNTSLEEKVAAKTAELSRSNEELQAFSYSLSHDLRSPLKVIDGFIHLLGKQLDTMVDTKVTHYLSRIKAAVTQMNDLIEGMLELNRVSHGPLRRQDVDLSELATEIAAHLQLQEPQREVRVAVAGNMRVNGDPRLLRAVLENLMGNAWKFTAKQPQAEISMDSFTDGNGMRVFSIRDNGAGFDMSYAEKLFKAFERLHSASEFPGTGVGLATVARVIARHGGRIWAESALGEGAVFYWTIGEDSNPSADQSDNYIIGGMAL